MLKRLLVSTDSTLVQDTTLSHDVQGRYACSV